MQIPDHFCTILVIAEWDFIRFISISHTVTGIRTNDWLLYFTNLNYM